MSVITGKKLGFKKGDLVYTGAFPGIIVGEVHTYAPVCEVWGFEHETGSTYATDLRRLTPEEFVAMIQANGYKLDTLRPYQAEAKKTIIGLMGADVAARMLS